MIAADRARPFIALLLLGAHLWLAPCAYMDPPDPLWIGGLFDEADYDDVVLLVMAMTGVVGTEPVFEAPAQPVRDVAPVAEPTLHWVTPLRARPIRAPPSA